MKNTPYHNISPFFRCTYAGKKRLPALLHPTSILALSMTREILKRPRAATELSLRRLLIQARITRVSNSGRNAPPPVNTAMTQAHVIWRLGSGTNAVYSSSQEEPFSGPDPSSHVCPAAVMGVPIPFRKFQLTTVTTAAGVQCHGEMRRCRAQLDEAPFYFGASSQAKFFLAARSRHHESIPKSIFRFTAIPIRWSLIATT